MAIACASTTMLRRSSCASCKNEQTFVGNFSKIQKNERKVHWHVHGPERIAVHDIERLILVAKFVGAHAGSLDMLQHVGNFPQVVAVLPAKEWT
jgi:hypothetical protein